MLSYQDFLLQETHNDTFVEKRKDGAKDIAEKAKAKGGYAKLTFWHFKSKLPEYDEAKKAIDRNEKVSFFEKKVNELLKKINPSKMTQEDFQKVMGKLEVWGEVLIQVKNT